MVVLNNNGVFYDYDKVVSKLKEHRGDYPYCQRMLKRIGVLSVDSK